MIRLLIAALLVASFDVVAQECPGFSPFPGAPTKCDLNQLNNSEVADADEVMENFNTLADAIDGNSETTESLTMYAYAGETLLGRLLPTSYWLQNFSVLTSGGLHMLLQLDFDHNRGTATGLITSAEIAYLTEDCTGQEFVSLWFWPKFGIGEVIVTPLGLAYVRFDEVQPQASESLKSFKRFDGTCATTAGNLGAEDVFYPVYLNDPSVTGVDFETDGYYVENLDAKVLQKP